MFERVTSRFPRTTDTRTRAAVLAAGLGATVVLGAGVAVAAAENTAVSGSATAVQAQAAAQAEAAKTQAAKAQAAKATKAAAAKKQASWVSPVKSYQLSASFAANGGMWAHKHSGQDYAVPTGTKVMAAHGGTVVKAGGNGAGDGPAYGNAVVIKHGNGKYSQYAHLSQVDVKAGQVVKTGQKIALSGNTGNSSGPHLHFEIRTTPNYGSAINPATFLRAHGVNL
ncbi:M23 family metallopeptidase [Streptomyces edwardsiae]|uniref:M23 family metallopeptidase n=1 Tax=Streptomyces edwardsiae TaxID=3075527 RepID=A0ABU2Q2Y4_9ACTN|nr:M23 family metallopeptidase [Streptomyces sp. DSM 41636]MDT0397380.1 M23 family metallopeptidase [Streptomyces sp. DSM 41636]